MFHALYTTSLDLSSGWWDFSNLASSVNLLISGFDETDHWGIWRGQKGRMRLLVCGDPDQLLSLFEESLLASWCGLDEWSWLRRWKTRILFIKNNNNHYKLILFRRSPVLEIVIFHYAFLVTKLLLPSLIFCLPFKSCLNEVALEQNFQLFLNSVS